MFRSVFSFILIICMGFSFADKPNVIVILADDMGMDSVSAFNPELGFKTPRIDSLIGEGFVFTEGHSGSAVCTPTRYGILTGRYSWRSRLKRGIVPKWDKPLIEQGRLTIAEMFRKEGYHTACVGKWHLGWNWPFKNEVKANLGDGRAFAKMAASGIDWQKPLTGGPLSAGFDYHFGDDVINWPPFIYIENEKILGSPDGKSFRDKNSDWADDKVLPAITDKAVKYIEERAKAAKPFFLYFPMTSPHSPIIYILTDGRPTDARADEEYDAMLLSLWPGNSVRIHTVCIGKSSPMLQTIAEEHGGKSVTISEGKKKDMKKKKKKKK